MTLTDSPPRLARALLWLAVPDRECESIAGDLEEEYREIDARTRRSWYWRQVFGSLAPLTLVRWYRGELVRSLIILIAALIPLAAANELWRFVLSCVPLKADPDRPLWLFAAVAVAELLCVLAVAAIERMPRGIARARK